MDGQELVKTQEHTPPPCPGCGEPLDSVEVQAFDTWTFDPGFGQYKHDPRREDSESKCSKCGEIVDPLFPDGVASHYTKKEDKGLGAFSDPLCDECPDGDRCQEMCAKVKPPVEPKMPACQCPLIGTEKECLIGGQRCSSREGFVILDVDEYET